ncbi:hypothetical protein ScalyP_jg4796 [Parmales sp. scaly parma]|nr:hypothetical protein ScalyP_jg4796 [Parmales sp. scaly parma]|tara:strand:+ start:41 stop:724 length:684 start_codon:yes stop_codon:yes gene_type:complete
MAAKKTTKGQPLAQQQVDTLDAAIRQTTNNLHYLTKLCVQWSGMISFVTILLLLVQSWSLQKLTSSYTTPAESPSSLVEDPMSKILYQAFGLLVSLMGILVQPATWEHKKAASTGLKSIRFARIMAWLQIIAFAYFFKQLKMLKGEWGQPEKETSTMIKLKAANVQFPIPLDGLWFFITFISGKFMRAQLLSAGMKVREARNTAEKLQDQGRIKFRDGTVSIKKKIN